MNRCLDDVAHGGPVPQAQCPCPECAPCEGRENFCQCQRCCERAVAQSALPPTPYEDGPEPMRPDPIPAPVLIVGGALLAFLLLTLFACVVFTLTRLLKS